MSDATAHSAPVYECITDLDGRFRIGPKPEGAYWLEASFPELANHVVNVRVAPGSAPHTIELVPGATVRGRLPVAPTDGRAMLFARWSHADESLEEYHGGSPIIGYGWKPHVIVGRIGRDVRADNVPPGHWIIYFGQNTPEGYVSAKGKIEILPGDRERWIDLQLAEVSTSAVVSGSVLDGHSGEPLRGARVVSLPWHSVRLETDVDGRFASDHPVDHPLELGISLDGWVTTRVEVPAEAAGRAIEISLDATRGLDYLVEWFDGHPADWIELALERDGVEILREQRVAAADHWARPPEGRFELVVDTPWSTVRRTVQIPGPPVHVVLPPAGAVSLRIPDLEVDFHRPGGYLQDARAVATPLDAANSTSPVEIQAPYEIRGLPPGRWRIDVFAEDGRTWTTEVEVRNRKWTRTWLF